MSVEKIPGANTNDNKGKERSVELLAKVDNLKEGDVIILNSGERYTLTEPILIEDKEVWRCIIERSKKSGVIPEESLVSVKGLKDFVEFGRVKEFVLADDKDAMKDNEGIYEAEAL